MSDQERAIEFDKNPPVPVNEYESVIELASPGYAAMHTMVLACLQARLRDNQGAKLLIVGAGGGAELIKIGQNNPLWEMTGVDPSEHMLKIAQDKVERIGLSEQVFLFQGLVQNLPLMPLYNAATSILVMQFLPDDGSKINFLKEVFRRLKPLSSFIIVDVISGEESQLTEMIGFVTAYRTIMGVSLDTQLKAMKAFREGVYPVSEVREIELLKEAGFINIIRFYTGLWINGWIASVPGA